MGSRVHIYANTKSRCVGVEHKRMTKSSRPISYSEHDIGIWSSKFESTLADENRKIADPLSQVPIPTH